MTRVEATPTPTVLIWARKAAGMAVDVAARRAGVKVDQLSSWENGAARPSIPQLRKLASIYRRPMAAFYLPEPPRRFEVMHDFRRFSNELVPPESSPKLAYEIRRAFDRRDWSLELMAGMDGSPRIFDVTAKVGDDIEEVAMRLRRALGVTTAQQNCWRVDSEAFKKWRILLESAGILTLQATEIQLSEARGFSVSLKPMPAVVVNIKDAPRGRIFTLLHEATHVMLNEGGICDLHDADAEAFCNRVAGATLFPRDDLLATGVVRHHRRGEQNWTDLELQEISRQFGGSREAALVRLLTLRLTTQAFYDRMRREFLTQYEKQRIAREEAASFAPPHVVAIASAGPMFTDLVIQSFNRERITASEVSDYLQIRVKHLKELQGEFPERP